MGVYKDDIIESCLLISILYSVRIVVRLFSGYENSVASIRYLFCV